MTVQQMFRGNANNQRSNDMLTDAQVTENIHELTRALDETRAELAKLRAEHEAMQQTPAARSAPPPPTAK
jgi:hypothetical protein